MSFLRLKLCFLQQVFFGGDKFLDEALKINMPKIWPQLGKKTYPDRSPQTTRKAVKMYSHLSRAPFPLAEDRVKVIPSWILGPKFRGTKAMQTT